MTFSTQAICTNEDSKVEVTVSTSAGTSQLIGQLSGAVQVRVCNYDTVRVAFRTGAKAACDAITVAGTKTIQPGGTEVFTVQPNSDGSPVYWNVRGDTGAAGNKFEVTLGMGI